MSDQTFDSEINAMQTTLNALKNLQPQEQKRVLDWLGTKLSISANKIETIETPKLSPKTVQLPSTESHSLNPSSAATPKDFMDQKNPNNGVERVACLSYYLTHKRNQRTFDFKDLSALNTDAAQAISIRRSDVANAERASNYLAKASGGKKQITSRGESLVNAMPDRTKVSEFLKKHPIKRKKQSKTLAKSKTS